MKKQNKQKKEKNMEASFRNKHFVLRLLGFLLALGAALFFITRGVLLIGHKNPGYHKIETTPDAQALLYAKGVDLQYYFAGKSDEIKAGINGLKPVYSAALQRAYKLLDADNEYEGIQNIATFNAHPGEDLTVSEELFEILLDAKEKSEREEGFNLFSGALYRAWRDLRYLDQPQDFDPLRNTEERERLDRLTEAAQNAANVRLVVVDAAKHVLRLEVAAEYRTLLEELELEAPILDLNLLHDAYLLQIVASDLERASYAEGFLSTESGLTLVLSANPRGQHALYAVRSDVHNHDTVLALLKTAIPGTAASRFSAFPLVAGEHDYYQIDGHLRHPYLPADGEYRDLLLSSLVIAPDPVSACFENIRLQTMETREALESAVRVSAFETAYCLQDQPTLTVFTKGEDMTVMENDGWQQERLDR